MTASVAAPFLRFPEEGPITGHDARRLGAIGGGLAAIVTLILSLLLWRVVLAPLGQLGHAMGEIRAGRIGTRLRWRRRDEFGVLARDFDVMAEDLEQTQARLESLALCDPLTGLANHRSFHEALSRLRTSPQRPPDVWFAQARRCGLGPELEALAVRRALEHAPAPDAAFVSVNLSPGALVSSAVLALLPQNLGRVVVEITEHEEIAASRTFQDALDELRSRGARIALDDAGAGYAGLEQLMRLRPDIIKLDRALIRDVPGEPATMALLEALVSYARRIKATVCAEGIETVDQLLALGDLDVTYGQGFGLARPAAGWPELPAEVLATLHERSLIAPRAAEELRSEHEIGDRRLEAACAILSRAGAPEHLRIGLELLAAELGADEASVSVWDGGEDVQTLSFTPGWMDVDIGDRWALSDYPATAAVLRDQQAVQVQASDPGADRAELELLGPFGFGSLLMLPAMAGGRSVGLLEVARRAERPFTRSEVNRARVIAYQLGALLHSGRLGDATPTDGLRVAHLGEQRAHG